ncbi:putative xanthine dehydrogenase subunit A [compost metagenome]
MAYRLRYLGIMGSKERTAQMLEGFERPDWLHAPIGLHIGSEGAYENAVSIVAELIAIKRGKQGAGDTSETRGEKARWHLLGGRE